MGYRDVRSRKAVIDAMKECDVMGRDSFRTHYGFAESRTYYLRFNGEEYDSKPILAVAHKYQFPEEGPLPNDFSGGKTAAARHLARLGFSVDGVRLRPDDWTLKEVEFVVEDYFQLFEQVRAGQNPNKSALTRATAKRLSRRNEAAVGRKNGNISAVLERLQLPWVTGIRPLPNRQTLLDAVVFDWLADHPEFFSRVPKQKPPMPTVSAGIEVDPPSGKLLNITWTERKASKVNFAERDEKNRSLGRAGEEWALAYLREELREAGRADLAKDVRWVSKTEGDGLGYDIASYSSAGDPLFVEVKTTNGGITAPFMVTTNELGASRTLRGYVLLRVFDFGGTPRFYRLEGDLKKRCQLDAQLFRAMPK